MVHNKMGGKTRKFKKMNCAPNVQGKTIHKYSCFTNDVILKLKESYNKHHQDQQQIKETSPLKIWKVLKKKMSYCSKEACWLDVLEPQEKKNIEKHLFSPKKPIEWKRNPREWLSNIEILQVLNQYQTAYPDFLFIGPTTIDFDTKINGQCVCPELCEFSLQKYVSLGKTKIAIVYNLDNVYGKGTHWVSHFIDINDKFQFYFNSSGNKIPDEIKTFVDRVDSQAKDMNTTLDFYEMYSNDLGRSSIEHQMSNTECGMYSLYFIITMLSNETENPKGGKRKFRNKTEKINYFKKEARITDERVAKYRNILFND